MEQDTLIPAAEVHDLSCVVSDETDSGRAAESRRIVPPTPPTLDAPRARRRDPRHTLGPLLAVGGLCGGAGASTLAYLIARHVADVAAGPVLVCDTGGPGGGLAAYSRVQVPRSLPRIANAVAAFEPVADGLFADDGSGLRVIASRPQLESDADERGVARVLHDARAAHALTVVDCGTLRASIDRQALQAATHIAWIMPATAGGITRAAGVLALFELVESHREVLVARHAAGDRRPPIEELTALAASRGAPLALMPSLPDLGARPVTDGLDAAALTLEAIRSVIGV